jgi:hypothetical protein
VTKADDSSLNPEDLHFVEGRGRQLLDRASAWECFPTPIDDLLAAAKLKVAPTSAFDPRAILTFLRNKGADVARSLKSAMSKILGIYEGADSVIHIDDTAYPSKKTFLKLHETGHHELPTHRKSFLYFQDCETTLSPEIVDQFEREANNFARFVLFQGDTFARYAADCDFGIKTPVRLAKKFGASVYASCREFARSNPRACAVYALEQIEFIEGDGARAEVRRIEASPKFKAQFGTPGDQYITLDHVLGPVLPIGRKMTRPTTVAIRDRNGVMHECVAEAFDTTTNAFILLYPVKELTATTIILPAA